MNKRQFLATALSVVALPPAAWSQPTSSQSPYKIIVATPAGGASDAAARLLAQQWSKQSGQQVIVENKPGGNGVPAMLAVMSAPADGRTLLWAMSSMAGTPLLVKSSPVQALTEFVPVAPVVNLIYGFFVNAMLPVTTVAEMTAHLRAHPDRLNYGTGVLSEYMVTTQYLHAAGLKAQRVPYKGGAQLMPDLITGVLQFNFGPLAPALPHVKSGKIRLLATLPDRAAVMPGVPSLADAGISTDSLPTWNGLVARPGTARETAGRISQQINLALTDSGLRTALEGQGFRVSGGTPQQMGEAMDAATKVWAQFVRDYDIPQE